MKGSLGVSINLGEVGLGWGWGATGPETPPRSASDASATPRVDLILRGVEETEPYNEYQLLCFQELFRPVVVPTSIGDNNKDFIDYEEDLYGKDKKYGTGIDQNNHPTLEELVRR